MKIAQVPIENANNQDVRTLMQPVDGIIIIIRFAPFIFKHNNSINLLTFIIKFPFSALLLNMCGAGDKAQRTLIWLIIHK